MSEIPFFVYSLSDELTLRDYESGFEVGVDRIKERSIMEARKFNYYLPDYVYRNRFEAENVGKKDRSLAAYLVSGLTGLAKRYLVYHNGKLYVKKELHEEWMGIMCICPPLIIEAAFFLDEFQLSDKKKTFFERKLLSQFNETAQRLPLMFDLEHIVKMGGGLWDLHAHLNGSTETDVLWWTQMGCIDFWTDAILNAATKDIVKQQYEQGYYTDVKLLIKRIRNAKDLVIKSYKDEIFKDEVFERIANLYQPYRNYPVLAKAAYYYLVMLNKIRSGSERLARLFHEMLLIQNTVHRLVVQQETQKGFTQFQMITENDIRWRHESSSYRQRFEQLAMDVDCCFLEYLEGRFAPKSTKEENRVLFSKIVSDFLHVKEIIKKITKNKYPKLGLIAHFIKKKEDLINEQERHFRLRKEVRDKGITLLIAQNYLRYNSKIGNDIEIAGIDAAANEMDAGPEIFSPTFRWLRQRWRGKNDLRITFHAGEDFVHILSGLRMMYEAVEFLDMKQGDRIGHGTAAGIDPDLWLERVGDAVYIKKGEWLDDLLIVYKLIESPENPYMDLRAKLPTIHNEIEELTLEIYGKVLGVDVLYKCWQCRKYEPDVYLKGKNVYPKDSVEEWKDISELLKNELVKENYYNYHYDIGIKEKYCELRQVLLRNGLFTMKEIVMIQNLLLHKIALKNIALEVPISSNLCISFYRRLSEHHIGRWLEGHSVGNLLIPPIVLGSDDSGIFMTNIYIEYARLMNYLEQKGYNFVERINMIQEINRNSKYFAFS